MVLALIWYFGYYKTRVKKSAPPPSASDRTADRRRPRRPPAEPFRYPGPPTPFTEAAEAWRQRVDDMRRSSGAPVGPASGRTAREPAASGRPRLRRPAPAWQTYPPSAGPSTVQDPVSPDVLEAAAHADFLATADPVGALHRGRPASGRRRPEPPDPGPLAVGSAAAARVGRRCSAWCCSGWPSPTRSVSPITPLIYAASALLVVGLTLVAATWLGRARGILPVGLLLLVVVLGLSVADPGEPSSSTRSATPASPSSRPSR